MAMYCPLCNKEFDIDVEYCDVCGTKTEMKKVVVEPTSYEATPRAAVATASAPAKTATSQKPIDDPTKKVVTTGAYFGLMLLFSLPLIGLISCLLMCFIPKNQNLKNYAKAHLIWSIISLIVTLLLVMAVSAIMSAAMSYVQAALPESFGNLFDQLGGLDMLTKLLQADDLSDIAALLGDVDWSQVDLEQLQPLLEQLGVSDLNELQPLLEQLGVSDLNELQPVLEQLGVSDPSEIGTLIAQLDAQDLNDLNTVLEQMDVDNVSELVDVMNRYQIDSLDELANLAAQG